ncbi:DISARM system SNF2-like helicase DrmD [Halococcus sp. AFM35]|uniref:DISARM system SNF2-like helicase DrmD n=1 Tax=Halococcus sp. AFM35 TaxID=3421653 RepID=UPI003EB9F4AD
MSQSSINSSPPERGQLIQVRNRPALVTGVTSANDQNQPMNLVSVDYLDGNEHPQTDEILWELEPTSGFLDNAGWPNIPQQQPDRPHYYDAYLDSVQWTSLQSIQSLVNSSEDLPLVSPWASAIQIEDYQLTPLLKAMSMPQVSLLLADDVGLGKTIQAGLIARELVLRRRIKRILIVCPASLQVQWQEEMEEKFHLDFTILDADEARRTQREFGSDVNPWAVHNHIITSMDYLRQEVIYQDFEASAKKRQDEMGGTFAPWDLLIVDEAHHFAPKSTRDDKVRTQMMRRLTKWFEHRLFLTATPHDGYTSHFLGLLELLDPIRFIQKPSLSETDQRHLDTIMSRRLKREINQASTTDRFPDRHVNGVPVELTPEEEQLFEALREYRGRAKSELSERGRQEEHWGQFVFTILNKRLLSSPYAFARTWWRHVGSREFYTTKKELQQTFDEVDEDIEDDIEREDRERLAMAEGGSWLLEEAPDLEDPAEGVSKALRDLGWTEEITAKGPKAGIDLSDSKADALVQHLKQGFETQDLQPLLGPPSDPKDDERLIIFTEYKDTQDQILTRLEEAGYTGHTVQAVYGGMSRTERDDIKEAFNDPDSPLRILVGTDSASEGLNLQRMCRYVSHYEIPWNPMRLEQRNGRVDRHGQERDVGIFHYTSDEQADQRFLAYVLNKVNEARDDLGSVGTVIDSGVQRRFWGGIEQDTLDDRVERVRSDDPAKEDLEEIDSPTQEEFLEAKQRFQEASREYDLTPDSIRNVVNSYLELHNANLQQNRNGYRITDARGRLKEFLTQNLADAQESMPELVFDSQAFLHEVNGREIYRPQKGARLIRIGHPIVETSMSYFRRAMWGQEEDINRWTLVGYTPDMGKEAYVEFHYLVTARNQHQEVVHADVGSWWFHVTPNGISRAENPPQVNNERTLGESTMMDWWDKLRPAFVDVDSHIEPLAESLREETRAELSSELDVAGEQAREQLEDEFEQRMQDLEQDLTEQRKERLREQLTTAEEKAQQLTFDPEENVERQRRVEELRRQLSEEDLQVWEENQRQMRERLQRENERFLEEVLPKRYTLADEIEVTELGAKLYVPEREGDN